MCRSIRLCCDVTDVNNTENSSQERWQHDLWLTELPKPELPGVMRVTPAGVTLVVVGETTQTAVTHSVPAQVALIYTMHEVLRGTGRTAHEGGAPWGCDQSIGSIVSDAIVRSWLWLTATMSSRLGCFSTLLQLGA